MTRSAPTVSALLALALIGTSVALTGLPLPIFVLYVLASLASVIAYAVDKSAARNDRSRVRESTLHLLALAGGWPGALLAQQAFRHKTRKRSFRWRFWLTVFLNGLFLLWLHTAAASGAMAGIESLVRQALYRFAG